MTLTLNELEVKCIIGDLPNERNTAQVLRLDIAMEVSDLAAETDDIADAVDYAKLSEKIQDALAEAKCHLIERAAKVALDVCMSYPLVSSARVSVTKSGAVPGLASAAATAESRRAATTS